jgi:hypothetical protein
MKTNSILFRSVNFIFMNELVVSLGVRAGWYKQSKPYSHGSIGIPIIAAPKRPARDGQKKQGSLCLRRSRRNLGIGSLVSNYPIIRHSGDHRPAARLRISPAAISIARICNADQTCPPLDSLRLLFRYPLVTHTNSSPDMALPRSWITAILMAAWQVSSIYNA